MLAVTFIPHVLAWGAIVMILLRWYSGRRPVVMTAGISGFAAGVTATAILLRSFSGGMIFAAVKSVLGVSFLLFWGISVAAIYHSTARGEKKLRGARWLTSPVCAGGIAALAAGVAGAVCSCRIPATYGGTLFFILLALASVTLASVVSYAALFVEKRVTAAFTVSHLGMLAAVVSLLLFSSSSLPRLDLFSPLSMKVMKGVHDFVHQFMESILTPDHLFVRPVVWKYIGLLFGKEVGFWGGMIIWFTPVVLMCSAIYSERLPSVAHIRQGAQRRRQIASALRHRRMGLIMPLFSVALFGAAAYQSSFPSVEYWDPKPLPVTANPAGEIIIPKKGEIALEDGKLHKYLFRQGGREARFFVLLTPAGQLTVDLDACAICKPDGYGQADGSVICYYCKTLIPLETVGKPGGCNPVPVRFSENDTSVVIDAITLINTWSTTVQSTVRGKEGGK